MSNTGKAISTVGVVGSGIMGSGIAQLCAQSGYRVILHDVNQGSLEKAHERIQERLGKWAEKQGEQTKTFEIIVGNNLEDLANTDIIIEAISEQLEAKQQLFSKLEQVVSQNTILASNTSGILISKIASVCEHRDRIIGTHFFNPAPIMPLIEVIHGPETSRQTKEIVIEFAKSLNKKPVEVQDVPGFVVNRIITPMLNEAMQTLEAGIATREDIDQAIKLSMNHPMGPLQLADYIGLDTLLHFMETAYVETGKESFKPSQLLKDLVSAGSVGIKSGKGFYEYSH
ncbi:MAG TPA: 3-hydroxyacyl-CoA dehydrogenase family protein [Bacilli bacterium]|nr:3-hydroxyacyl-CoA dehydrogenase family protein [Bacilli bacterium]